jgi:protein TonB
MNWPRLAGILLALCLHGSAVYALFFHSGRDAVAVAEGNGSDSFTVVATVSLDSADLFTQDAIMASDAGKNEPREPPKEERPKETGEKSESPEKMIEPVPSKEVEKAPESPPAEKPQPLTETASVASVQLDEQRAASALAAQRNKLWSAYEIALHSTLERHKLKPRTGKTGEVIVQIVIAQSGELVSQSVLKSSGSSELDKVALASLEAAAPFPPVPPEVSSGPLTLDIPFHFQTR